MKWVVEPEVFQTDFTPFLAALARMGVDHEVCRFGSAYESYLKDPGGCVVFHGSWQFARLAKQMNWAGMYCSIPKFECPYYYPRFGGHLLNEMYAILPFGDLIRRQHWIFSKFAVNDVVFIRQCNGFKSFTGMTVAGDEWEMTVKKLRFKLDPEFLVLVAPAWHILREWRAVVVDNKIVGISQYNELGKSVRITGAPTALMDYAEAVLSEVSYRPDPVWVLDFCESAQHQYSVMEVGPFACCGLYACDPEPVIRAVNDATMKIWGKQ